jgi:hypothetical protein
VACENDWLMPCTPESTLSPPSRYVMLLDGDRRRLNMEVSCLDGRRISKEV